MAKPGNGATKSQAARDAHMKIAILTQPLGHNYGGLLQAFALQAHLRKGGHTVETIDRRSPDAARVSIADQARNIGRLVFGRIKSLPTAQRQADRLANLAAFRDRHLAMSPPILDDAALRAHVRSARFDAIIVGSDQVWRPRYSPNILNFYLDFLEDGDAPVRKLAYAASFGVDSWEYTPELTAQCGRLLTRFDAVSVREGSAVTLCRDKFGIEPDWVVDPTLLLEPEDYDGLLQDAPGDAGADRVVAYVLQPDRNKRRIADEIATARGCRVSVIIPEKPLAQIRPAERAAQRYPGVDSWVRQFRDARFVVTDSFHGTVFAILFNRPFIAIGNPVRGMARFESLLSQFGLADRLVGPEAVVTPAMIRAEIDWDAVNRTRRSLAAEGRAFLDRHLADAPAAQAPAAEAG